MKRSFCVAILLSFLIAMFIWWLSKPAPTLPNKKQAVAQTKVQSVANLKGGTSLSPAASNPTNKLQEVQSRGEEAKQRWEHEVYLWQSPLLYYGKVVDESNQPIAGVQVSYGANSMNDAQAEVYNTGTVTTDERGIFKIDGVRGVNLMVQLSDPDYYAYPENSTGFDKRSLPKKGYFSDSEENAELFRMHSKGHPVPLVHRRGGADVPVNSGSATVEFYGQQDKQVVGTLQIKAWGDTPKNWNPTSYDWGVQLTVPNGGFVESTNQFDFIAPDSGYQQSIKIDMNKDQPGWSDTVGKTYFVKLANGYLRMNIRMRAKTPLYVSLEYYYNPDDSRNLEPAQ